MFRDSQCSCIAENGVNTQFEAVRMFLSGRGGADYDCALTVNDYFLPSRAFEHKRTHTGNIFVVEICVIFLLGVVLCCEH